MINSDKDCTNNPKGKRIVAFKIYGERRLDKTLRRGSNIINVREELHKLFNKVKERSCKFVSHIL